MKQNNIHFKVISGINNTEKYYHSYYIYIFFYLVFIFSIIQCIICGFHLRLHRENSTVEYYKIISCCCICIPWHYFLVVLNKSDRNAINRNATTNKNNETMSMVRSD